MSDEAEPQPSPPASDAPRPPSPWISIQRKILAALVSTALVLVVGAASIAGIVSIVRSREWVRHTREVMGALSDVRVLVLSLESNHLAHLLTGDARYEEARVEDAHDLAVATAKVGVATADNPEQRATAGEVERCTRELVAKTEADAARAARGLGSEVVARLRAEPGSALLEDCRAKIDLMTAREEALLVDRQSAQSARLLATSFVIGVGSLLAAVAGVIVNIAIRRGVEERRESQRVIERQAKRLAEYAISLRERSAELSERLAESKSLAERLQAANKSLDKSNRDLDQFVYVASHDLKAPLRGIASLSEWIEEDLASVVTDDAREQLKLLRGRVHRMESLLEGILAYSRAGRDHRNAERVLVHELAKEAVELASAPEGVVTIDVPADLAIETERVPLLQVLMNLVSNALKHGASSAPHVRIEAREREGRIAMSVTDDGPGIDPRYHEKIFRMFQRLSSRDKVEGAGIGLAVVKKLVEAHGGSVRVESELGRGATFTVDWPRRATPAPARNEES